MKVIFLAFIFLFSTLLNLFAQKKIEGQVLDEGTKLPIAFANVGIENTRFGTATDENGFYSFNIPKGIENDTISFSSIGYGKRKIPIILLKNDNQILLHERVRDLEEVLVSTAREKNKTFILGNTQVRGGTLEADTLYSGKSYALLIENSGPKMEKNLDFPVYLENAELRILRNNLKSFKIRLRILKVDPSTGLPGDDLILKNLVQVSEIRNGWLSFDLSDGQLIIDDPFFLVFETLTTQQDRIEIAQGYKDYIARYPDKLESDTIVLDGEEKINLKLKGGIDIPGTFIAMSSTPQVLENYKAFSRESNFSKWERISQIITARVTLSNQAQNSKNASVNVPCELGTELCLAKKYLEELLDEYGINGAQFSVSKNGGSIKTLSIGLSDLKDQIPVNDSTLFQINSISKSITSLGLMKLVAAGKLDLDRTIQEYVPSFPEKKYPISVRQLAGHLGGIRDYNENDLSDYIRRKHYSTATEAIEVFSLDSLVNKPGSEFHYSTFGWNLLGAAIEGASGEVFEGFMQKEIWDPLNMSFTQVNDITKPIANKSKFYDLFGTESDLGDPSYQYPGGGLLSTTGDLVSFGNEILYGSFIPVEIKSEFLQSQKTDQGDLTKYGLGWYVNQDSNGNLVWHHEGDSFDSSSFLWINPESGLVVAILLNSQYGTLLDMDRLVSIF